MLSRALQKMHLSINDLWYRPTTLLGATLVKVLSPLSWLFRAVVILRRRWLQKKQLRLPVPVVVVGNISVGGTGKSPVVIALAMALKARGYRPGIISRGYGSHAPYYPFRVEHTTSVEAAGDEPLMIVRATQCPLVIGANRYATALTLLAQCHDCDMIISDDGLQHYHLPRALEIAVVDGKRGFGNGCCLPAGPLREPVNRLDSVDWLLVNGAAGNRQLQYYMANRQSPATAASIRVKPRHWLHIQSHTVHPLSPLPWLCHHRYRRQHPQPREAKLKAVASIGNPQRFFATLNALGLNVETRVFPDHHHFTDNDLACWRRDIVLMTSKDAVKCQNFAGSHWWALEIEAQLPAELISAVVDLSRQPGPG